MNASEQPEPASDPDDTSAPTDDPSTEAPSPDAPTDAAAGIDADADGDPSTEASAPEESTADEEPAEDPSPLSRISRRMWILGVLALAAAYLLTTFLDVWLTSTRDYDPAAFLGDERRAAVVLGAAQYNGEPSPVLRARLDEAARLYETGQVDVVVVTGGGQPADITTEAKSGYTYLREEAGIPDERLLLEVQGGSTYESLAATARFLREQDVVHVVLVTDRFHAKRSILIAEEVGLVPMVSPTPPPASFERLVAEAGAVALGRVIGFRRLDQL